MLLLYTVDSPFTGAVVVKIIGAYLDDRGVDAYIRHLGEIRKYNDWTLDTTKAPQDRVMEWHVCPRGHDSPAYDCVVKAIRIDGVRMPEHAWTILDWC